MECTYIYKETSPGFYPVPTIKVDGQETRTNLIPLKEEKSGKKICPVCKTELEESQYLFWTHKK